MKIMTLQIIMDVHEKKSAVYLHLLNSDEIEIILKPLYLLKKL